VKLLHVVATPKKNDSASLDVSGSLIEELLKKYPNCEVETLRLYDDELPHLSMISQEGELARMQKTAEHFSSFDYYIFSAPMWNLSIPSILKTYIDHIVVKDITFRYNKYGIPLGLLKNKKAICVFSRGGLYSFWPLSRFAHDKKYMNQILKFMGIKNISFIEIDGLDRTPQNRRQIINKAIIKAVKLAKKL